MSEEETGPEATAEEVAEASVAASAPEGASGSQIDARVTRSARNARGYSWPQATPGNTLAVKAGAHSPRIVAARAEQVRRRVLADAPHLGHPEYQVAVELLSRSVARSELIAEHIERVGVDNVSARMLEQASTSDNTASRLAVQLGLDPRSQAELAKVIAEGRLTATLVQRHMPVVAEVIDRMMRRLGVAEAEWRPALMAELDAIENTEESR